MRSLSLAAISVLSLVACGAAEPAPTTTPPADVPTTTQTALPPAPSTELATETASAEPQPTSSAPAEPTVEASAPSAEPSVSLEPVPQPTPQGGPWTPVDLTITDPADLATVAELPVSFQEFMATRLGVEDDAGCTITAVELKGVHADGYVYGGESSTCGDSQVVWAITEDAWQYAAVFLDAMPCRDLELNSIPAGAPGLRCMDDEGEPRDY